MADHDHRSAQITALLDGLDALEATGADVAESRRRAERWASVVDPRLLDARRFDRESAENCDTKAAPEGEASLEHLAAETDALEAGLVVELLRSEGVGVVRPSIDSDARFPESFSEALAAVLAFCGHVVHVSVSGPVGGALASVLGRQGEATDLAGEGERELWHVRVGPEGVELDEGADDGFASYALSEAAFVKAEWGAGIGVGEQLTVTFDGGRVEITLAE